MTDEQRQPGRQDEPRAEDELDDLEPADDDADGLKGGGGSTQNQTGSEPENLTGR